MIRKVEMERFSSRMMALAPRFAMPQAYFVPVTLRQFRTTWKQRRRCMDLDRSPLRRSASSFAMAALTKSDT